jgi:hypothetical protein
MITVSELLKALDGKKTYISCVFSVVIAGVAYYLKMITLVELVGTVMAAITFILNRSGNKADAQKVIKATSTQVEKAISIVPCKQDETNNTLNKAVDAIVNPQNIEN